MSGKAVGWAMEQVTGSPVTKLVLLKLADNANDNGLAYPSLNLIVAHTELSKRTVIDHLEKLEKLELIEIERSEIEGLHITNRYRLKMPAPEKIARPMHHKKLAPAQPVVAAPVEANNPSPEHVNGGGVGATPVVQPTHEWVVSQLHQGGVAGAEGGVAGALRSVADANPPAPPIEINPQTNPQTEPSQNAGARATPSGGEKIPDFLLRDPFEQFMRAADWHPASNRDAVRNEYAGCADAPEWGQLVAAAKRYAAKLAEKNAQRRKDDPAPSVSAQTFIRRRMWQDFPETRAEEMARLQPAQEKPWGMHPAGALLLEELGAGKFDAWLRPLVLSMHEGQPMLTAPSKLIRNHVATHYIDRIERAFGRAVVLQ